MWHQVEVPGAGVPLESLLGINIYVKVQVLLYDRELNIHYLLQACPDSVWQTLCYLSATHLATCHCCAIKSVSLS